MTTRFQTDEELELLRAMRKRVHRQRSFKARGEHNRESRFEVYQRQNIRDATDFSCGIAHVSLDGSRLTLARYNGPGHEHGDILYRPHIHRATAEAMASGKKPEHQAEETDRFETLEGALACLIDDFNVVGLLPSPDGPRLF